MVKFVCDNKETEKLLRKLYEQVVANGGVIHDKLTIVSKNGDLKITVAESVLDGEEIIALPKKCLLPVDKYKLDLDGYKIILLSHDKDLSDEQVTMMKIMIELFNLTEKIEAQKNTSTFSLHYEDKNLLQRILRSRSENGIPVLKNREEMSAKTYYLKSFLKTRTLTLKKSSKGAKSTEVLMPIIDCLNHHAQASRFTPKFEEISGLDVKQENEVSHVTIVKSCPIEGSNECYVKYGPYDSMDALIQYNYPDESAFYVRSVPVQIDLPGGIGSVVIRSMTWDSQHKELPENLKDLELYIPVITVNVVKDTVNLNFIYIPSSRAPNAMRRVLALALGKLEFSLSQSQMMEILRYVEKRIINENIKYFDELSEHLNNYEAKPAVKIIVENTMQVIATQLKHIKNYKLLK